MLVAPAGESSRCELQWAARGQKVPTSRNRSEREPDVAAAEDRPDAYVYCKGCGKPLESRARLAKPRAVVDAMMCQACQQEHGHALMPSSGSPTFCYRCGRREEVFVEPGTPSVTHYICPHCLADRAARYAAGDFTEPQKAPAEGARA
jgi:hypothetical protein